MTFTDIMLVQQAKIQNYHQRLLLAEPKEPSREANMPCGTVQAIATQTVRWVAQAV